MAKKLALIDPDLLLRIINEISSDQRPTMPTEPNLREMGQMRDKMNDYLQDSDMDNETALHGYNSALQRYLTHFGKIDKKGVTQPPPGMGPLAGSVSALTTDPTGSIRVTPQVMSLVIRATTVVVLFRQPEHPQDQ